MGDKKYMKLTKVKIKNFRSIKDSGDVDFTDNLFVGINR